MASSLTIDELLARNKAKLHSHQPIPTLEELKAMMGGSIPPQLMVVSCADPRCIPENFLDLHTGEAIVLRNPGGNLEIGLPSVLAFDVLFGLSEIIVVKHTDCGTQKYTTEGVKSVLRERAPSEEEEIQAINFGSIAGKTLEEGLKEQVEAVRASELVRADLKTKIRGFIYDLESGALNEVEL